MKRRVVLYVDILHDLHHCSKIYTGLDLLARSGAIDLHVTPAPEHSLLQWVDLTPPGRVAPLRVAFDLGDHNDLFIKEGLDRCDVYFKRSYFPPHFNEERAALISLLRKTFGPRFRGGLVPTPFARQRYPDVLLEEAYRRPDFIGMVKTNLIGVCTRGLHHSLAFKVAEYLAASMCIVSDPMLNQLPEPLAAGEHYLQFSNLDQCLVQCDRLLSRPDEAREMRRRNYD